MMIFAAAMFTSCGNSKVNGAYKAAVTWNKSSEKDPYSSESVDLFKKYVSSLAELNNEERGQLLEKLKKAKLDVCAGIAKLDVKKAKELIESLGDLGAEGANKILEKVEEGVESFDTESFERALEEFTDSTNSAFDDLSESTKAALEEIDSDELSGSLEDALKETENLLNSLESNSSDGE